jgi:Polyketide cyclase / dehydrase and lipid transport
MRKMFSLVTAGAALVFSAVVWAEAPELRIAESITIDAPPDAVWALAGDFRGLDRWYPFIDASRLVLGRNGEVGAIREIRRLNGTKVEERLIEYDPWNRRLTYTYAEGAPMTSDYFASLQVKDAGGGKSLVEWNARFRRLAYWTETAPAGQEDETLVKVLTNAYKKGLENLKKVLEAGK